MSRGPVPACRSLQRRVGSQLAIRVNFRGAHTRHTSATSSIMMLCSLISSRGGKTRQGVSIEQLQHPSPRRRWHRRPCYPCPLIRRRAVFWPWPCSDIRSRWHIIGSPSATTSSWHIGIDGVESPLRHVRPGRVHSAGRDRNGRRMGCCRAALHQARPGMEGHRNAERGILRVSVAAIRRLRENSR